MRLIVHISVLSLLLHINKKSQPISQLKSSARCLNICAFMLTEFGPLRSVSTIFLSRATCLRHYKKLFYLVEEEEESNKDNEKYI